jgi:hypothetical protein
MALDIYFAPSAFKLLDLLFIYFINYSKFKLKLLKLINFIMELEIYFAPSAYK